MKFFRFFFPTLLALGATVFFDSAHVPFLSQVDWFLLAVAYQATAGDFAFATLGGAADGLLQDALLFPLIGANAFAKALLGFCLTLVSLRFVFGGMLFVAGTLTAAKAVNDLIVAMLGGLLRRTPVLLGWPLVARAIATGAAGGIFYWAWHFPWRQAWEKRRRRRLR